MDSIADIVSRIATDSGMPPEVLEHALTAPLTDDERLVRKAEAYNSTVGELKYYDCPLCLNRGDRAVIADGTLKIQPCACMIKRENMRRLQESGLEDVVMRYTFAAFETPDDECATCKDKAMEYARDGDGKWFIITGKSGSGKTHLCTAIAAGLIRQCHDVRYVRWREIAPRLKALINEREGYEEEANALKTVDVLYLDDFLKGSVSAADINLAYEIINARYSVRRLRTIISTERSMDAIIKIDEALGSRIYERCKGFVLTAPKRNWRLR